jgi:hypothetical protein
MPLSFILFTTVLAKGPKLVPIFVKNLDQYSTVKNTYFLRLQNSTSF